MLKETNYLYDFINHELEQYSHYSIKDIILDEEYDKYIIWSVEIQVDYKAFKELTFRTSQTDDEKKEIILEVELCEDCWEQVHYWEPSVKYFWMALLTN